MQALYKDQRFKDITLKCSDGEVKAHKSVLASSSNPVFKTMFEGNFSCAKKDVIDYPFAKVSWMEVLIRNIYGINNFFVGYDLKNNGEKDKYLSITEMNEAYYFAQYFYFKEMKEELDRMFEQIKIETLTDEEFDTVLLFSDIRYMKVDKESVPWILNKIFTYHHTKEEEQTDRFFQFIRSSYLYYDNTFKEILEDERITHELFEKLFSFNIHNRLYTNEDIINYTRRGLIDIRTAYILSGIKTVIDYHKSMKNQFLSFSVENKVKEMKPLTYEFNLEISIHTNIPKEKCGDEINIIPYFAGFNPIIKIVDRRDKKEVSLEEFNKHINDRYYHKEFTIHLTIS